MLHNDDVVLVFSTGEEREAMSHVDIVSLVLPDEIHLHPDHLGPPLRII